MRNYDQEKLIDEVLKIAKFKEKVKDNSIKKTIHVQNKILNIII